MKTKVVRDPNKPIFGKISRKEEDWGEEVNFVRDWKNHARQVNSMVFKAADSSGECLQLLNIALIKRQRKKGIKFI